MSKKSAADVDKILGYIGANVRGLRIAKGWTQVELSEAAGIIRRHVQQLETGKANPTVKVLIAVANALDVPPTAFFKVAKLEERLTGRPPTPK